ncbi:CHAT domain-containing protein [Catellatospora bangladeshensis]|uniref:CHAT domain-containing protein n=1 Tax=Catellatospora bangladeshensis TaxID=310355 RepID=A0A8J3NKH3_9ACTN|nr:CHAT domain-containing protein [Catellatospora bangladeshensis]GIF81530.1 hypothetical protein Cba03nite_28790 [Catellatospora bangladeshensis]
MTPPPTEQHEPDDYTAVAADGPVVVVNVSKWRSDAVVVLPTGIEVVPLRAMTTDAVEKNRQRLDHAQQSVEQAYAREKAAYQRRMLAEAQPQEVPGGIPAALQALDVASKAYKEASALLDKRLIEITEWLWDALAAPVLDMLGIGPATDGVAPRLWWCPTGLLTLLPLHAAGYHRSGRQDDRVMAHVVSSYTPTLDALTRARKHRPSAAERKMLLVALGDKPGATRLLSAEKVERLLVKTFAARCTVLSGEDATAAAVRAGLREHDWVHFSCHADQDLTDPFQGGPILYDTTLSIADISRAPHGVGEFAFLGACKTNVGGTTAPDEVITLASALHHAGFRHVVGTMWSIEDHVTAPLVEHFYAQLARPAFTPDQAARALHHAVDALRLDEKNSLSVWAPFTHTGP